MSGKKTITSNDDNNYQTDQIERGNRQAKHNKIAPKSQKNKHKQQ